MPTPTVLSIEERLENALVFLYWIAERQRAVQIPNLKGAVYVHPLDTREDTIRHQALDLVEQAIAGVVSAPRFPDSAKSHSAPSEVANEP